MQGRCERLNARNLRLYYYVLTVVYVLGGFLAIVFSLITNQHREYVGVVFIIGAIIPLILGVRTYRESKERIESSSVLNRLGLIAWLFLFILSTAIYVDSRLLYYLPLELFIVVFAMVFVILTQIFFSEVLSKREVALVIFEIVVTSLLVSSFVLFLYPGGYGNDASYHLEFIRSILTSGSVENYPGSYPNYPIYHILFVEISSVLDLGMKVTQFLIAGIQAAFVVFIFFVVRRLVNLKVALFSTVLVSFAPHLLQARYMFFPFAFSFIYVIFALFLVLYWSNKTPMHYLLLIVVFLAVLFCHPLTPLILIVFLLVFTILSRSLGAGNWVSISGVLLLVIMTLGWWMKSTSREQDLFSTLILSIKNAFETVDFTGVERATLSSMYSWGDVFLYDAGMILLLLAGVSGAFLLLGAISRRRLPDNYGKVRTEKMLVLSATLLLLVPLPYVLTILYPQSLPDRWFPLMEIVSGMTAGIVILYCGTSSRRRLRLVPVIGSAVIVFFMITAPVANPNSHIYSAGLSSRSALTVSETQTAGYVNWLSPSDIHANSVYLTFVNQSFMNYSSFIDPNDPATYGHGILAIRSYDLEKGFTIPLFGSRGLLLEIVLPTSKFNDTVAGYNRIYDSSETRLFYK
jgi:hypothetical protein